MLKLHSHSNHSNFIHELTDGFRILASVVTGNASAARVVSDVEFVPTNVVAQLQVCNNHAPLPT